ncbi:hypothetical protein Val02_43810 [Virgisporangium aliadipatigenens]|uniref:Maleylpyruvate isomerase family mycothiol-dependent enzyme n=1 Tax=Virgisporangium aliadipatigenens TaxID=741659 RepID=A0A8J3YP76_9ACTN|nr:maleylpyruvate isomerase family mycothiol-dependent enzyme [Virgisporangium aliadipatigenens]GIJ47495.1 hypothetical protein Val02_43810 [Virgisporangium aliadipatigenens]
MARLTFDDHCAQIVAQTELLHATITGADLTVRVPSCPEWNLVQLLRHLGGGQHWAAEVVRTRATAPPDDRYFRDLSPDPGGFSPAWLLENAASLAAALREAGPDAGMWTPVPGGTAAFFARRFAHETLVHRADATLAVGAPLSVEESVAVDALDEWLELGSLPIMFEFHPRQRELLGPGRTIHLHATDAPGAEWLIDLTGDVITWRRAHEKAAVAVRAPLTDLVMIVYRRVPVTAPGVAVFGDRDLLDFWLDRVAFG